MRSATSFFDKTLFRSQLKHTWPLWLGYTALWLFLVPVALFSELSAYQGGYSAVTRVLAKTKKPYNLSNVYKALASDSGNQVGTYKTRQAKVYQWLNTYMK